MSAPKFTAGPWRLDSEDKFSVVADYSGTVVQVADVYMQSENARLIAAAPEMYALAVKVAEHFKDTDAPLGIEARAVLAKAVPQ